MIEYDLQNDLKRGERMKDLMAKKDDATIKEFKTSEDTNDNCIRIYCTQAPDVFNFQIRTFKPITDFWGGGRKGKPRNMIATVELSIAELEEILEYCKSVYPNSKRINVKPLDLLSLSDES